MKAEEVSVKELHDEEPEQENVHSCGCGGSGKKYTGGCGCGQDAEPNGQAGQCRSESDDADANGEFDDSDPAQMKQLLEEKTSLAEDYFQRLARLQADFDNYKRRTVREREDLLKYSSEQIITAFLPILDNFDRAMAYKDDDPSKVIEGLEMIYRQIHDVLGKEGLAPIPAAGESFDPAKHEAVMQEENLEQPDNTVLEELRRGYILKDKVIRPAMVKVAKSM